MNCIDAVEGTVKCVLTGFEKRYQDGEMDDTDYVRNVKTLIEGVVQFLEQNREIGTEPELVRSVLYDMAKNWWKEHLRKIQQQDALEDLERASEGEEDYKDYYFDYIYRCGVYPA